MKRIKPEQKKLIVSIVAIIIVVTMIAGLIAPFVYGAENDDSGNGISIEASIGFDAYTKMNKKCLYEVTVKNNSGDDIEGEVQVIHEIFAGYGTNKKEYQV
ncbi:MAG: type IV pilin, partial [Firmicutes bacterium]|nr:type IV pilin [Bacillota bacterium]